MSTAVLSARLRVGGRSRVRDLKQVSTAWTACALGRRGTLPAFAIIGAQRAGTTALFNSLAEHPQVRRPIAKEVQYLTLNYGRGPGWYAANFPRVGPGEVTFEASPYYLFHPLAPQRAAHAIPGLRVVVLLRDPVRRAYSHWQHSTMHGFERLSFARALEAEPERLADARRLGSSSRRGQRALRHHSYLARGRYAEQLQRWHDHLGADRVLTVSSEAYFLRPAEETARVLGFLGLRGADLGAPPRTNHWVDGPNELTPALECRLREALDEDDARLVELLGWQTTPWP